MSRIFKPDANQTRRELHRYFQKQAHRRNADWLVIHPGYHHADALTEAQYRAWQHKHPRNNSALAWRVHAWPVRLWRWVKAHLHLPSFPASPAH